MKGSCEGCCNLASLAPHDVAGQLALAQVARPPVALGERCLARAGLARAGLPLVRRVILHIQDNQS